MTSSYTGTPKVLKDCPICQSKDGRCRERDGMILCMTRIDGQKGEKVAGYEYLRRTQDNGEWGIWVIPLEDTSRLKQLSAERISIELAQGNYKASREERDEAYRAILAQLPLAPCDLLDLESRGLSREQIESAGFKSVEQWQSLRDEVNWRVPGVGPSGRNLYAHWKGGGYLCPARDIDGFITGLQVRLRQPDDGGRYRWLSSSDKRRPNKPVTGIRGELPLSIYQHPEASTETVWLVEGIGPKPAIASHRLQGFVVGASGRNWASSPIHMRQVLDRAQPKHIILVADAGCIAPDSHGNQHTLNQYTKTYDLLKSWGYEMQILWWGQDTKPEATHDKLNGGDIDEIGPAVFERMEYISIARLREMGAVLLQNWKQLNSQLSVVGGMIPESVEIPEPAPLPEETPLRDRLRQSVEYYVKVDDVGDPFLAIEVLHNLKEQYPRLTDKQLEKLMKVCRDARRRDSGLVSVSDTLIDNFSEIEQRSLGIMVPGIPCGFRELDNMTQGLQRSDLILAAARPGLGKTSFVLNIARNIAGAKLLPVAFYSLEMSKTQLVYRLLAGETEISSSRLRAGKIIKTERKDEWAVIGSAIADLSRMPIFIDDTPSPTVADIKERSMRLMADQGDLGCIIIDYLQLMGGGGSENRVQELSQITRSLKNMARELNIPVIALSQLSRGVESRTNKRPMMSDLRDSGALEQDADLIMMLYREDYYDPDTVDRGIAEVIITKHRNGPTGTVKLLFEPEFTRFKNMNDY